MNKLMLWCAARPAASAGAAALLLHAAVLASLVQLPTRGERLLADAYPQQFASLQASPAAAAGHHGAQTRLARLAQRWLHLGGEPATTGGPV